MGMMLVTLILALLVFIVILVILVSGFQRIVVVGQQESPSCCYHKEYCDSLMVRETNWEIGIVSVI